MKPFPDEWKLLDLFEVEPRLLDPDVPWAYNEMTFETVRGSARLLLQRARFRQLKQRAF
jgi:hypothetical protein